MPNLIYAREGLDTPILDLRSFDRMKSSILVVDIGFCRDLRCTDKSKRNARSNSPLLLVAAPKA